VENPDVTFEQLIYDHQPLIHKICNIYGKSEADREDLFQEIVIQLWKSFASFEHRSKISTWMYRVALNTAITQKRKEHKRPPTNPLSIEEMRIPDRSSGPERDEDELKALQVAIRQLKSVERAIIFLYLEEKSYKEIAEIIGITPKNVGVKIVRIKAKLLSILTLRHGK
jgi:RNA polymerase sigma-70 factor (ECF subfamily)